MARSLDTSPSQGSPHRESPRTAPYLTHELTHHGQVTLIPPQNAGRIRKPKQKGEGSAPRRRDRERDEPRFNTAVPATRRARTTSARVPRQPQPQNQVVEVRIARDSEIPEDPPPSFQEAIRTPPVSPDLVAYARTPGVSFNNISLPGLLVVPPESSHAGPLASGIESSRLPSTSETPATPPLGATLAITPIMLSAAPSPRLLYSALHPPIVPPRREMSPSPPPSHASPVAESAAELLAESGADEADNESSGSSDASLSRSLTPALEPASQWEADIQRGVPLDNRVYRERLRLEASESNVALTLTPRPVIARIPEEGSGHALGGKARCSGCERLKPLDCAKANEMRHPDNDSDETASSSFSRRIPSPLRSETDTASLPCSPMALATPVFATMNPWSSTVTLSSTSMKSPTKSSGLLKRKESVILRKLFGSKGKEPEKHIQETVATPPVQPVLREEPLGSWEVVDSDDLHTTPYSTRRPAMDREQSNSSIWTQVAVPTPPVFINRPVRPVIHAPAPPSPFASKSFFSHISSPIGSPSSTSEPSPTDKTKSRRKPPPPPPPPRKLRTSPSVVWKTSTEGDSVSPKSAADRLVFPSPSTLSLRSRAAAALTPITVPRNNLSNEEAGPSTLPLDLTSTPHTPTYAMTLASDPSSSPPASPSTPSHHYLGRPLPQVPHEPSPLARPVCITMTAAPSPLSQSEPYPPGSSSSPPQTPARHTTNTTRARAEYSNLTDLDVLASRLDEGTSRDGGHYDDLLRLAEFVGPARPAAPSPLEALAAPFVGRVEMQRRRVLRDGRVKLKLALLGTVVDRCGICLSQFKDNDLAALCISCQKACHEHCARRWMMTNRTCSLCRAPLDISP